MGDVYKSAGDLSFIFTRIPKHANKWGTQATEERPRWGEGAKRMCNKLLSVVDVAAAAAALAVARPPHYHRPATCFGSLEILHLGGDESEGPKNGCPGGGH